MRYELYARNELKKNIKKYKQADLFRNQIQKKSDRTFSASSVAFISLPICIRRRLKLVYHFGFLIAAFCQKKVIENIRLPRVVVSLTDRRTESIVAMLIMMLMMTVLLLVAVDYRRLLHPDEYELHCH